MNGIDFAQENITGHILLQHHLFIYLFNIFIVQQNMRKSKSGSINGWLIESPEFHPLLISALKKIMINQLLEIYFKYWLDLMRNQATFLLTSSTVSAGSYAIIIKFIGVKYIYSEHRQLDIPSPHSLSFKFPLILVAIF